MKTNASVKKDKTSESRVVPHLPFNHKAQEQLREILCLAGVQPMLETGQANDHLEKEADLVADNVLQLDMAAPSDQISTLPASGITQGIAKPAMQTSGESGSSIRHINSIHPINIGIANNQFQHEPDILGQGMPLPESDRLFFEPRFGADFSKVTIHTGKEAVSAAESLNAKAFTIGSSIGFCSGHYSPQTVDGQRLLAHELTHTIQQNGYRGPGASTSKPGIQLKEKESAPVNTWWDSAAHSITEKIPGYSLLTILSSSSTGKRLWEAICKTEQIGSSIIKDPVAFSRNFMAAVKGSFIEFGGRIGFYLKDSMTDWLAGEFGGSVTIPEKMNLSSLLSVFLQIAGVTYDRVRSKLADRIGADNVYRIEKLLGQVKVLLSGGITGLGDAAFDYCKGFINTTIDNIKIWLSRTVVSGGIEKLSLMLTPATAVIEAVRSIARAVETIMTHGERIAGFIESVFSSLGNIAEGKTREAVSFMLESLKKGLAVSIAFLAGQVGLSNITGEIKKIVKKLGIDSMIDMLVDWIVKLGKSLLLSGRTLIDKGAAAVSTAKDRLTEWWKESLGFRTGKGESHEFFFKGSESALEPWVASANPTELRKLLNDWKKKASSGNAENEWKSAAPDIERAFLLESEIRRAARKKENIPESLRKELVNILKGLFDVFESTIEEDHQASYVVGIAKKLNPAVVYRTRTMSIVTEDGTRTGTVGQYMTAEYLSPNHPKGSPPGSSEQVDLFSVLPTSDKVRNEKGPNVYIRGHLLNDNVGGPGLEKNLYPITRQANSDHSQRIENDLKRLVNIEGYIVYYEVEVGNDSVKRIDDPEFKKNQTDRTESLYHVDSTLTCRIGTYDSDLKRQPVANEFVVVSKFNEKSALEERKRIQPDNTAIKMKDFDPEKVELPKRKKK